MEKQLSNKEKYLEFCKKIYVPIYAESWYMDAICMPENWDVWLYYSGNHVVAAMPYYIEMRGLFKYITRPLLTQNNGILFNYPNGAGAISIAKFEEKVIEAACEFINNLGLDVFEEQFHWSFSNWLPFYWDGFTAITRYTFIIEETKDISKIWENISSKQRGKIKKGEKNSVVSECSMKVSEFYRDYIKIFEKQGIECPYSIDLISRLVTACEKNQSGKIVARNTVDGNLACLALIVWDKYYMYEVMGGPIPEYASTEAYSALRWDEIKLASKMGIGFDFEGSVVKRLTKSFREYGGVMKSYFRIRKVYNPKIAEKEMKEQLKRVNSKE